MVSEKLVGVQRLEGTIGNLRRSRKRRDFVLAEIGGDTRATAVGAALSGMGGLAIGAASIDSTEEADYVEFDLGDQSLRGWFWRFPFAEGDRIAVTAETTPGGWVAYGAWREADGCVAVYPHCYEGVKSHFRSNARFWAWAYLAIYIVVLLLMLMTSMFDDGPVDWAVLGGAAACFLPVGLLVFGFLAYRAARKTQGFARMAEQIFMGFGWADPANLNLRTTSKTKRRSGDPTDYGLRFFRY